MDRVRRAEEDALDQLMALPYDAFLHGPPKTPCHTERVEYLQEIKALDAAPRDPQVEHILTLISQIFSLDIVLVCLCAHERVYIRNARGFSAGDFPFRWGFCGWGIATENPECLVIEDARQDARMRKNPVMVDREGGMRFFAGVPLMGSSGHRLGMLIIIDAQPRRITADQVAILVNMSELVVRELEKDAALQARHTAIAAAGAEVEHFMRRTVACFDSRPVLFLDVRRGEGASEATWSLLHANAAVSQMTGVSYEQAVSRQLWALFEAPFDRDEPLEAMVEMAARGDEFLIRGVQLCGQPQRGTFTLTFRPGRSGALDEDTQLIGVPSYVPSAPADTPAEYYFVIVTPEDAAAKERAGGLHQHPQAMAVRRNMPPSNVPIEGLTLGPLIGKGSFGRVYRARWHDQPVAVKICSTSLLASKLRRGKPWRSVEAVQARGLNHYGIVRTYKTTTVLVQEGVVQKVGSSNSSDGGGSGGGFRRASQRQDDYWGDEGGGWSDDETNQPAAGRKDTEMETWLILEYANRGSLQSGIDRGWFQAEKATHGRGRPSLPAVLHTARTIAAGMAYLHSRDIIHGDLCGGNVLLTATEALPHKFTCKVADFGLSRDLQLKTRMETASYGTVTHMPPELLREGKLSRAADVYAFGVLVWEMATSSRAWAGMSHTQVLTAVGYSDKRLLFPDYIDTDIVALANACMARDSSQRPTFAEAVKAIDAKLAELKAMSRPPPQAPTPFATAPAPKVALAE